MRKLIGWDRYDSHLAVEQLNDLYKNELHLFMNLFIPSMKLKKKHRVGSRIRKYYDRPKTPLDRLAESGKGDARIIAHLRLLQQELNPFLLAQTIQIKLRKIYTLSNRQHSPRTQTRATSGRKRFPTLYFVSKERAKRGYSL